MRPLQPYGFRTFVAALLATLFVGTAKAQTASNDPVGFDVAGVKLGMTPDEANAALKASDPAMNFAKRYVSGPGAGWGGDGSNLDMLSDADKETAVLDNLVAAKGGPKQFCSPPPSHCCTNSYEDDSEVVTVWFSRALGHQQVIMIRRIKTFHKDPKPSIESLKSSILAKYPEPQPTLESKRFGPYVISWLFDARRQLLSGGSAKSKGVLQFVMQTGDGLPQNVRPGDGIGLNVVLAAVNTNAQLADQFYLVLYDAGALFRSVAQSTAAYQALKSGADAKQLERSKGAAQTKF